MGKVSNAAIKATAAQRAISSADDSDSNKADARRQLAASNKKIEMSCHNKAAQGKGKCVTRTEKAIRFGYKVCPACSPKNSAFAGNRLGFRIFKPREGKSRRLPRRDDSHESGARGRTTEAAEDAADDTFDVQSRMIHFSMRTENYNRNFRGRKPG